MVGCNVIVSPSCAPRNCFTKEQLNPMSRPFICLNTGNKAKYVNCCKDGDYCNRHVTLPPELEVGRYD